MSRDLYGAEPSAPQDPCRILIADDNPSIHDDFRRVFAPPRAEPSELDALADALLDSASAPASSLTLASYRLDHATQGEQAVELITEAQRAEDPYALVFMDIRMPPGCSGIESTERVVDLDPDVQVVLCTAYDDLSWRPQIARLQGADRVLILKKPFDVLEVQQLARALCDRWRLTRQDRERMLALRQSVQALAETNEWLRREMAERVRTEDKLRKARRLEGLGRLCAGLCHEINNPLSFIMSAGELLEEELTEQGNPAGALRPEVQDLMGSISMGTDRIARLVRNIRVFTRHSEAPIEVVEVEPTVASALRMVQPRLGEHITVEVGPIDAAPILGRSLELEQVLINLVDNAAAAMGDPAWQPARITVGSRREGDQCCIEVIDTGPGIDQVFLDKIFDPFFTTKAVDKGTGLGLSICHALVEGMAGTIEVHTRSPGGTTFTIRLPVMPPAARPAPAPSVRADGDPAASGHILVIDDEPIIRSVLGRVLRGHSVTTASTAQEGLKACADQAFDLILCDIMMPGINGCDFYRLLKHSAPGAEGRVVFITGGTLIEGIRDFLDEVPNLCMEKPIDARRLRSVVAERLGGAQTTGSTVG